MEMKSMALNKTEMKEMMEGGQIAKPEAPKYPYGLRIELNDNSMKKLGLSELPKVGNKMMIMAMCEVERVSQNQTQEGSREDMSLQITDMMLHHHTEKKDAAENLYGK